MLTDFHNSLTVRFNGKFPAKLSNQLSHHSLKVLLHYLVKCQCSKIVMLKT